MISIAKIPNEVLAIIFAKLGRRDLKILRLVCRLWSTLAINATNLFECVYISCRLKDLEVLHQISSHDHCRKAVRRLVYDASTTSEQAVVNRAAYQEEFINQYRQFCNVLERAPRNATGSYKEFYYLQCCYSLDELAAIESRLTAIGAFSSSMSISDGQLMSMGEISEGYNAYCTLARQEQEIMKSGELLARIVRGLRDLPNIKEVVISGPLCFQSPFYRSWPSVYLLPVDNACSASTKKYDHSKVYNHGHNILVRSLSASGRKIRTFTVKDLGDYGIPFEFYNTSFMADLGAFTMSCMLNAYSTLENLSLPIDPFSYDDRPLIEFKGFNLQMPNLIHLILSGGKVGARHSSFPFDLFGSWSCPQLRFLSLTGMKISEKQLLRTLEVHALRFFDMRHLELDGSCWATALDLVRNCKQRPRHIYINGPLYEYSIPGEYSYQSDLEVDDLIGKMQDYLNFGGANPLRYPTST